MPLHQRRPAVGSHLELDESSMTDRPAAAAHTRNKNRRRRRGSGSKSPFLRIIKPHRMKLFCILSLLLLFHRFFLYEYAWVYQRCLVAALFWTSIPTRLACHEAWNHMMANHDAGLLWTEPDFVLATTAKAQATRLSMEREEARVRQQIADGAAPQIRNVHYTLTAPFSNNNTSELGKCSVEAMAKLCGSNVNRCRLNLWVVDRAAGSSVLSSYLEELVALIRSSGDVPYCIRVIRDPLSYDDEQASSELLFNNTTTATTSTTLGHCPRPTRRSRMAGRRVRAWLGSDAARQHQIPEHASDAWRLLALLERGGLYLDMDVIPLSPLLLQLPQESVPVQHRIGAYRINGGVMRLGDGQDGGSFSTTTTRLRHSRRPTFLEAVEEDHLYWAPILARLPASEQTFGFLGPAALTRVFTSHAYDGKVTILPKEVIEPTIDASLCEEVENNRSLAAHFSRDRKKKWRSTVKRHRCLETMITGLCPRTMGST